MMNDLTGMEGRKLRMPSVSPLRVMGRVTGRQRGWALGINTIPFHFPATAFPVETATPRPANLSSAWLWEAMTICDSLLWGGSYQDGSRYECRGRRRGGRCCVTDADFCLWSQQASVETGGWVTMGCTEHLHRMYQHEVLYTTKVWEWNFPLIRKT